MDAIYVWVDWESTGLWIHIDGRQELVNVDYERFDLPKELVQRFNYWTAWFNNRKFEIEDEQNQIDHKLFETYGLSLAVDLKLFLQHDYRVFYGHDTEDNCVEVDLIHRNYDNRLIPIIKSRDIQ